MFLIFTSQYLAANKLKKMDGNYFPFFSFKSNSVS